MTRLLEGFYWQVQYGTVPALWFRGTAMFQKSLLQRKFLKGEFYFPNDFHYSLLSMYDSGKKETPLRYKKLHIKIHKHPFKVTWLRKKQ
jgi:hypothetical protein